MEIGKEKKIIEKCALRFLRIGYSWLWLNAIELLWLIFLYLAMHSLYLARFKSWFKINDTYSQTHKNCVSLNRKTRKARFIIIISIENVPIRLPAILAVHTISDDPNENFWWNHWIGYFKAQSAIYRDHVTESDSFIILFMQFQHTFELKMQVPLCVQLVLIP